MYETPSFKEDHISQIPALQVLQNLGYQYLTPDEALRLRKGKPSEVILYGILEKQLREINRIRFKGEIYPFSEGNIQTAVQALRELPFDGLIRTNEKIYDLLCLGKSLQQSINGNIKSFDLRFIDWETPCNNVFHVTEEFTVERQGSHETRRPDIILFVNGLPLVVIECKRPDIKDPIEEAISQQIRNQKDGEIPDLFLYSQLLLVLSKNEAKFGTTGTPLKFWSVWKEKLNEKEISGLINKPLSPEKKDKLFQTRFKYVRSYFDLLENSGDREITEQDRTIFSLCKPERLLELFFRFILFDAGEKKISRYQQFFCVKKTMNRITVFDREGKRKGGVVWHTQGSGKSLTMVMLAKAIALDPTITNYKIVLVTDRVDLDEQIWETFRHCGKEPCKARTGKHLIDLIEQPKKQIITTVIDKFEAALGQKNVRNEDRNIFVLVDESHRGQYGPIHAKMKKVLPNACFIGFTGTPLMKKDKNTVQKFGGLIDTYTIREAVEDKAVVPLLYEGRHVVQKVDKESIDSWFERLTESLSKAQQADLKKKFSTSGKLNEAEQKIMRTAWDIAAHYKDNWQHTDLKGQLVAPSKLAALRYKRFLDEFGMISSKVLISGPDDREGNEDIYDENKEEVIRFWKKMMDKYGTEKEYNRQLINSFKHGDEPEIIIVVNKLLTGFDAPRNTILYLTKQLKEHSLLQAIARVNRLCEGKDFGFVLDYYGVLSNLDQALELYSNLPEYAQEDLQETLTDITNHINSLAQKYSDLWDIFKRIENKRDEEAFELHLADDAIRIRFYERLSDFYRTLSVALSSAKFLEETDPYKINKYKSDANFFIKLRNSVRKRYAEVVDFKEYEKRIQKLIDTHVGTGEVEQITELVNIFDKEKFDVEVEKIQGTASRADTIAYRTEKTIKDKFEEDPAFYKKFSELLQETIRAFREQRLSDADYLKKVTEIMSSVRDRTGDDIPNELNENGVAKAFYGVMKDIVSEIDTDKLSLVSNCAKVSLKIDEIIRENRIINWETNPDIQNHMRNEIEDYLFEMKDQSGIDISFEQIDAIMEKCLDIAKVRYSN